MKPFENAIKSIYPPLFFPLGKGSLQVSPHPNTVPFIKLYIHKRSVHDYVCPCHINLPNILDVLFYRFVSSVQLQRRWGREKEEPLRYYATRERCNPDCETSWTSEFLSCRIAGHCALVHRCSQVQKCICPACFQGTWSLVCLVVRRLQFRFPKCWHCLHHVKIRLREYECSLQIVDCTKSVCQLLIMFFLPFLLFSPFFLPRILH